MLSKIEFHENMESFTIYANYLAHLLYPVLKEKNVSSAEREKMFSKFYVSATDESTKRKWLSLLTSIGVTGGRHSFVLYHYIFTKFFHLSLAYRNKNIILEEPQLNLDLTKSEEETLRYVAGYILYCIIKAVDTRTTEGKCLKSIISCWSWKDDEQEEWNIEMSMLDYTKKWVDCVNRGGLLNVSDEFYIFIRDVENLARTVLNNQILLSYCGEDLRMILLEKFNNGRFIDSSWCILTRNISNKQLTEKLKQKIFNKWINVRAYAFVKAWIQIFKRKLTYKSQKKLISEKGEPSMRKSLAVKRAVAEKGEPAMRKLLPSNKI